MALVAEAAALCRAAEVPLWVDAAQALGHVDAACGADRIYATSRKWLTGPRGVGLAGVAERWWDRLQVSVPDTRPQRWSIIVVPAPHANCESTRRRLTIEATLRL
jgi:pyridoxal 5-phosphate dependent beta-lyase